MLIYTNESQDVYCTFTLPDATDSMHELSMSHSATLAMNLQEYGYLSDISIYNQQGQLTTTIFDFMGIEKNQELFHVRVSIDHGSSQLSIEALVICTPPCFIWGLKFTSHGGFGRGVCYGTDMGKPEPGLMGFSFDTERNTGQFTVLQALTYEDLGALAYGGISGRLCMPNSRRHGEIRIFEYV